MALQPVDAPSPPARAIDRALPAVVERQPDAVLTLAGRREWALVLAGTAASWGAGVGLVVLLDSWANPVMATLLGLAAIYSAVRAARVVRAKRRSAQAILREVDALEAAADAVGWSPMPVGDAATDDAIQRTLALTGDGGWQASTASSGLPEGVRSDGDWIVSTPVERATAAGRIVVIPAYYRHHRRLWAALATDATAPAVTWDLTASDRIEREGPAPAWADETDAGDGPVPGYLASFEPRTRLRFAGGTILLCTPGRLEPALLDRIAGVLVDLDRRLPRRPGHGPLR